MSEPTKEQMRTRLAVINDHYKETMFCGDYPLLGVKVHNAEINAIFALIESAPAPSPSPDIKPGVNIGPLSGPGAISTKEVEEAMETLRGLLECVPGDEFFDKGQAALAIIRAIIDDYERVRAEVREWKRIALKTRPPLR